MPNKKRQNNPPSKCDFYLRSGKGSTDLQTTSLQTIAPGDHSDATMTSLTDVLKEIKSLRSDVGLKLDNIETRLSSMSNSLVAVESKMSIIQREVSSNTARVEEAEEL